MSLFTQYPSTALIFTIAVGILIFLLIRELVTWYWKLNKIVSLLEKIDVRLASIEEVHGAPHIQVLEQQKSGENTVKT